MHRRGTGPIALHKATNCSLHSYLIINNAYLGLYRDDRLALITNYNGKKLDRIRKKLHQTFKEDGIKITVELCHERMWTS